MKKTLAILVILFHHISAQAHPMPNTLIDLSVGEHRLVFDIKIPLDDLAVVFGSLQTGALPKQEVLGTYLTEHLKIYGLDGAAWQVSFVSLDTFEATDAFGISFGELQATIHADPPPGADVRRFFLHYDAILHQVVTHQAIVSIQSDWQNGIHAETDSLARQLAVIRVEPTTGEVLPVSVRLENGSKWKGFAAMFRLGMGHIAEGYDHLLFLLLLLVVGPLMATGRRWESFGGWRYSIERLMKTVTAFTVGHSLTLALCSFGLLGFSSRWVEVAIAFSILVTAVHALVPLFFKKEIWVAVGFGLIHGMAFSDTLRQLSLDKMQMRWSLLGFNLGIEAVQLAIVAVAAPLLFRLCQIKAYWAFRVAAGAFGCGAAVYWLWERVWG